MLDRQTIERAEAAAGDGPFLIALSGGGDSVALLHLLVERFGAARLRAAVIDHALRAGSDADARRAAGFAEALGVSASVTRLAWDEGENHGQQAARRKRYRALCDAARACGARVIALAHTGDDQAETVLMRAGAGSSWRGLAGIAPIAPAPLWPEGQGLILARPLLGVRRAALRKMLRAKRATWIEDPANNNARFERVRARTRLARLEVGGFAPMRLAALARKMRVLADAADAEAALLIARAVRFEDDAAILTRDAWRGGAEARRRALSVLLAAAAGAEREPEAAALERLEVRFTDDDFRGASLGGTMLARVRDGVRLSRDLGAVLGRAGGTAPLAALDLTKDAETIWDGRLALRAFEQGWRVTPRENAMELQRAGEALALAEAQARGVVSSRWLLEDHVNHRLGPFSTINMGSLAPETGRAFTAP